MAARKALDNPQSQARGRPLGEVLSALMNDFNRALVSRDVSQVYWQDIYKNNSTLAELTPNRIRIVEAKVSLPVAIEEIGNPVIQDHGITPDQIATLLSPRFSRQERTQISVRIHSRLFENNQHLLMSNTLGKNLTEYASQVVPGLDPAKDIDLTQLIRIQKEHIAQPHVEQETKFLYKIADLEKINPEYIIRLDLTLSVD